MKLKVIWRILTSKYFVLLTWNNPEDVDIKGQYRKEHKDIPIINEVIETIWKFLYYKQDEER